MKYRLEVGRSRSYTFPWFVRLARRFPSYKVTQEDGLEIHAIETDSEADLCAVFEVIRSWKGWAFYVDGHPAPQGHLWKIKFRRSHQAALAAGGISPGSFLWREATRGDDVDLE